MIVSTEGDCDEYFAGYENFEIHRLMLDDKPRTEAYQNAIDSQHKFFKDKVVMDVGAGTGILSIFCARAGAKKVYAVEGSNLAKLITKVAEENKVSHIIEVIHKRVEDVILPAEEKVDIIVSEWMGFYLLHEAMLNSVIIARDRHLKADGEMFPHKAVLYAAACSLPSIFNYWDEVYGVSMRSIGIEERRTKSNAPKIMEITNEDLLTEPSVLCSMDLKTVTSAELDRISKRLVVPVTRDGQYQGIALWFTVSFPTDSGELILSTGPDAPQTHWKQTAIVLQHELEVDKGDPVAWELNVSRSAGNPRHYDLQLEMLDPEKEKHPMPCGCQMTKCIVIRAFLEQADEDPSAEDYMEDVNSDDEEENNDIAVTE